jgi:uncharacterized small protein (DUF1192 family)
MNITVRKANVVLTVPEEQREEYLNKGFDVIDSKTLAVVDKAIPRDVNALSVMVQELQDKVKALTEENARLKAELGSSTPTASSHEEDKPEELEDEEISESKEEFTPINKRKPAKTKK